MAEDESRIETVYFLMSEENVKKELAKPGVSLAWMASQAPEPPFTKSNLTIRADGNFARVLGKYCREEAGTHAPGKRCAPRGGRRGQSHI